MVTIIWDVDGPGMNDKELEKAILSLKDGDVFTTGCELAITMARWFVVLQNKLELTFVFEGKDLVVNEDGRLWQWPIGFDDRRSDLIGLLIDGHRG